MPSAAPLALAAACALGASACAASPCPRGRTCGTASWIGAAEQGTFVVAPTAAVAGTGGAAGVRAEDLPVGGRPVLLRFDLRPLGDRPVERAVLALAPHPAWRPRGAPVRVAARTVLGPWSASTVDASGAPAMSYEPLALATLHGRTRAPVRLDVTAAVRAWQSGSVPAEGLALTADGAFVVFAGVGAAVPADRPRLEVVVR